MRVSFSPSYKEALHRLDAYLQRRGQRRTPERVTVLRTIYEEMTHFDAEALHKHLQAQGHRISRATVYNTLELLEQCGLIRKHSFSEGRTLYEKALIRAQHDHIVCIECGHIHEFCDPQVSLITESVGRIFGMKPERHELIIYASCTQDPCPNRPLSLPLQRDELQP